MSGTMNYIIDNIYLGCFESAENKNLLVKNNIKYIFNVAVECNNSDSIKNMDVCVHKYNIYDDYDINMTILEDIYKKINKVNITDGNILIHCAHGRSRSVCIVLFYLIKKHNWTITKALEFVKKSRPVVHPSPNYIKLLSEIDTSFDINSYYINYLKQNFEIKINENQLLTLIKSKSYDLNKIVNEIYI